MREHRSAHAIADREHTLDAGPAFVIDLDEAACVGVDAAILGKQTVGKRPPAHCDDEFVYLQRLLAGLVLVIDRDFFARDLCRDYRGAEVNREALFRELFQCFLCNIAVRHEQEIVHGLDNSHFGAEPAPHTAEFEPDGTGTDHAERCRDLLEFKSAPGVDDSFSVERRNAELDRGRAAGEDDVARIEDLEFAFDGREFHFPFRQQAAMSDEPGDIVRLE